MDSLVKCTVDTFENQDSPATNYGNAVKLWVNGQASHKKYALCFFAKPFPAGATVTTATLGLYLAEAWPSGPHTITVKRITARWVESKNNFNTGSTTTATNQATTTVTGGAVNQLVTLDVTNMMQDVANGGAWHGVRIEIDTTGNKKFWSGESVQSFHPYIDVNWSNPPDKPSALLPTDGAIFDLAQPQVGWTFKDADSSEGQGMSQVQANLGSATFTSPTYDSGMVANTAWAWTIAHSWANGDQVFWRVRVQDTGGLTSAWSDPVSMTRDSAGTLALISPPADTKATVTIDPAGTNNSIDYTAKLDGTDGNAITVQYLDPGGVTATLAVTVTGTAIVVSLGRAASAINTTSTALQAAIAASSAAAALVSTANHAANDGSGLVTAIGTTTLTGGVNSFVEEMTPPISWTFSGETQSSYRIIVTDHFGVVTPIPGSNLAIIGDVVVWDSGRVAAVDTSVSVPNVNYLGDVNHAHAYTVEVRVWDTKDRVDQPGSKAYQSVSQRFDVKDSAVPAAVLTLVAATAGATAQLTWTRTLQPDFFCIKRDGKIVVDNLDPVSVFVSGTTYQYNFPYAQPLVSHTYEVVAKIFDVGKLKLSQGNPTVTFATDPGGTWLVRPSDGAQVFFLDEIGERPLKQDWVIGEDATDYFPVGRQDPVHIVSSLRGFEGTVAGLLHDYGLFTAEQYITNLESMKGDLGASEIRLVNGTINIPVGLRQVTVAPRHPRGYGVTVQFFQVGEFVIHPPQF